MNSQCIIVFPIYRSLNDIEHKCLKNAIDMTPGYNHVFIKPQSFVIDSTFAELNNVESISFDDMFFIDIQGYNKLMLHRDFYNTFSMYKYILIHQSDAYLFKSELAYWCDKGYDYIGAPWFKPQKIKYRVLYDFLYAVFGCFYTAKARQLYLCANSVGNGGLSLRKVSTFLKVLEQTPDNILDNYIKGSKPCYNEDVFWSIEASLIYKSFKKPQLREALSFAFERSPSKSYEFIEYKLPFGCHAFNIYETDFWKEFIPPLQDK